MTKPSKVLIIGSGPIIIGQGASLLCVNDSPCADDHAQEGGWL